MPNRIQIKRKLIAQWGIESESIKLNVIFLIFLKYL